MIFRSALRLAAVPMLATTFAIGLLAATPSPAFAGISGTWATTGSLNTPRAGHSATLLPNGQVLVAGGESPSGVLASADLYNPFTGKWTFTGSMATGRYAHTAVLLPNGEVLVAGGIVGAGTQGVLGTATAELYNPSTGRWTSTGSMATTRFSQGATLLSNGQVLVCGRSQHDRRNPRQRRTLRPVHGHVESDRQLELRTFYACDAAPNWPGPDGGRRTEG